MTEATGEWLECVVDNDYEIYSEFPYPIRRKGSDKVIKESIYHDYVDCCLNCRIFKKHRIIVQQFITNDDPEHKTQVDHINHNRADNRVENLRWVSVSENNKNKAGYAGRKYIFIDELPETAEQLTAYNGYEFAELFIDHENQKLYVFNGIRYRSSWY